MAEDVKVVGENMVVSMAYKLTVDDEVIDEAGDHQAIQFMHGHRNIIPGLEKELAGMKTGESKSVVVDSEGGYGPVDESAIEDIALSEFPENVEPKKGIELQMKDSKGEESYARVLSVGKDSAKLDFNHPLAGKELNFEVKIVELRPATDEELSHGHVHAPGHSH